MTNRLSVGRFVSLLCALAIDLLCAGVPARANDGEASPSTIATDDAIGQRTAPTAFLAMPRLQPHYLNDGPIRFKLEAARPALEPTVGPALPTASRLAGQWMASARPARHRLSLTAGIIEEERPIDFPPSLHGRGVEANPPAPLPRQSLPPPGTFLTTRQPPFANAVVNMDQRLYARPGHYVELAWELPAPLAIDYLHYDNDADPRIANQNLEWSWRTRFGALGATADLSPALQLRAQALSGSTRMGHSMGGRLRVDTRFQAAYVELNRRFERGALSLRTEAFRTRNRGKAVNALDDEDSWAATLAARRDLHPRVVLLAEATYIRSDRADRLPLTDSAIRPRHQLRISVRTRW